MSPSSNDVVLRTGHSRRRFLAYFAFTGLAGTAFPRTLLAQAEKEGVINKAVIKNAEQLAGLEFTDEERGLMVKGLGSSVNNYEKIRELDLKNGVVPAFQFNPIPAGSDIRVEEDGQKKHARPSITKPAKMEDLAFLPLTHLSELVRTRQVSSTKLTRLYLSRLKEFDEYIKCVITLTEERALEAAALADKEIAAGSYRGPLHGIPWGAKDLLAVKGYPTTWGAAPYKNQVIDEDATVVKRLDQAGAVLVAKLTLGAIAMGDVWFGGRTRNPWNVERGSSGSSAGPAAAAAAGLVGFAVGSETCGSIVSPCHRCGVTGLRPTFGRVSRHGAMALSWTMDKLGPICRSVEDCALVFEVVHGRDGLDPTVMDHPFTWLDGIDPKKVKVGYTESLFEEEPSARMKEWHSFNLKTLEVMESLGFDLIPVELPDFPVSSIFFILSVEAAAAFDDLTRSNRDDLLTRQNAGAWPNILRKARMVPAVEYVQANRARQLLMQQMARVTEKVDLYICPTYGGSNLMLTNLTGHPAVVLPNGFTSKGTPTSIVFNGSLFGESKLLAVAHAYQQATRFHLERPDLGKAGKDAR